MSNVSNEVQERQAVLSSVFSVLSNLPEHRLSQVLTYVREIEDLTGSDDSGCPLSNRELEVLTLIANGYSRKQVGECLGISANTAARHISTIYTKLGVSSIAEATRYAIRNGLA